MAWTEMKKELNLHRSRLRLQDGVYETWTLTGNNETSNWKNTGAVSCKLTKYFEIYSTNICLTTSNKTCKNMDKCTIYCIKIGKQVLDKPCPSTYIRCGFNACVQRYRWTCIHYIVHISLVHCHIPNYSDFINRSMAKTCVSQISNTV